MTRALARALTDLLTTASIIIVVAAPWWLADLLQLISDLPE